MDVNCRDADGTGVLHQLLLSDLIRVGLRKNQNTSSKLPAENQGGAVAENADQKQEAGNDAAAGEPPVHSQSGDTVHTIQAQVEQRVLSLLKFLHRKGANLAVARSKFSMDSFD